MNFYFIPIKLLLLKNTQMDCTFDPSNSTESLFIPFIEGENRLEVPKKFHLSINELNLFSFNNNDEGGAIKFVTPIIELYLNNTNFKNNYAFLSGGALHFNTPYSLIIKNCTFENNTSGSTGGTIHSASSDGFISIEECESKDSIANHHGGTLYLTGKNITINNFESINSLSGGYGGTIYSSSTGNINISNITLKNSKSSSYGGNLYLSSSQNISIENFDSFNSTGSYGGNSFITSVKHLILNNITTFNTTGSLGGNYYITAANNVTIEKLYSLGSKGNGNGGNLWINSPNCSISNSWFETSVSSSYGGTIYATSTNLMICNCFFGNSQSSHYGGALYISSSATLCSFILNECTFYEVQGQYAGGAIYLSASNQLFTDFSKICFFKCRILSSSSSYQGTSIYISCAINEKLQKLYLITSVKGGITAYCDGNFYLLNGQHYIHACNFSENKANKDCIGYLNPSSPSIYQYLNCFSCTSSDNYAIFFKHITNQIDFDYSNIINNSIGSICIYVTASASTKFFIKFCILMDNIASTSLLTSVTYTQTFRNCFINHNGPVNTLFSNELSVITTSLITSTYLLTHYSTFICPTPIELGHLEIDQTINCQTLPPIPTSCSLITENEVQPLNSLSTIFNMLIISLFNLK